VGQKISTPGGEDPCGRIVRGVFRKVDGLPPFIFEAGLARCFETGILIREITEKLKNAAGKGPL
jgi:hypothetical protein